MQVRRGDAPRGAGMPNNITAPRLLPGHNVYPISSFTWMLFYQNPKDKKQGKAMVDFMKWALTDGQKFAGDLGYAPIPKNVVDMELKTLATIKAQ